MKIKRNNVASETAVKKVINTLNLSGTPIFVKYTCIGLNSKAKTMLVSIGVDRSPTTHNEKKPPNKIIAINMNCWFFKRLFNFIFC